MICIIKDQIFFKKKKKSKGLFCYIILVIIMTPVGRSRKFLDIHYVQKKKNS